ncbi:MAG: Type 1 glutamine amidotransferase-like domain-containing protein [Bacilli bacterium]|nr:Type 1 glutamine amidotransferase-like domain-containing protein [Bacilli bacterium]
MKLMLIGGGNTRNGAWETKEIDIEAVKMTGKEKPNFLFVGIASQFADSYYDAMKAIYKELGCECQYLKKKNIINNRDIVENKIRNADIIYIGGGDTIKLMTELEEYNLKDLFVDAVNSNKVIVGISAGAIMLCSEGYSDSLKIRGESDKYDFIKGLGILPIVFSPHHSEEKDNELNDEIGNRTIYGLENGVALKIEDNKYTVVKSIINNNAYLINKNSKTILEDSGIIM